MTISNQTARTGPYNGNGSTTVFAYDFRALDQTDIVVTLKNAANVETVQTLTTNYTVSGVGGASGGNITMGVAPASGEQLTISRAVPQTQIVDLANRGAVAPEVLEGAYDKLTQLSQDKVELLNRMPRFPVSSSLTGVELPLTLTANTALIVNAGGTGYTNGPTASQISGAEASAVAAAASAAAAATSYDNFDDRYLGQKSSDPSVDNDGGSLITGALYFNTSNNVMMVYTGSAWVRTTPTSTDQTTINAVNANATNINTVAGVAANVTTVAGISSNVTSVAGNATNVNKVAAIDANVTKVGNIDSDVSAVAAIDSDVAAVENIAANVTTVAGVAANVTTVAGVASNVTTVAGVASNVTTVAGIAANVTTTAGISSDVTTVAGIAGDVTAVAAQVVGYDFSTTTTMADPGSGNVRFNHATLASVSAIAIDDVDKNGVNQSAFIILWDDSTNTVKGTLVFRTAGGDVATFLITGLTDNAGWSQIAVTHVASSGTFSNGEDTFIGFTRAGDKGADGEGSGDVTGPGSATDNTAVRFNSTTGKLIQASGVTIDDSNNVGAASLTLTTDLAVAHGGTGGSTASAARSNLGAGDASGPASATDNALVRFDGTGGKTLQNSGWTLDDTNVLNGADNTLQRVNLLDYAEVTNAIGSIGGGAQTIDLTLGNTVTGTVDTSATTFTFSNPTATDECCAFTLFLTNGGSQTVNWPASVDWPAATAPTLTASGLDILVFTTVDGGTIWHGMAASTASS
jgi:hypothetical protein